MRVEVSDPLRDELKLLVVVLLHCLRGTRVHDLDIAIGRERLQGERVIPVERKRPVLPCERCLEASIGLCIGRVDELRCLEIPVFCEAV